MPVVLVILREGTTYGYELMERAVQVDFEAMNPGTLYRTLRKMEKDGLCGSEWKISVLKSRTCQHRTKLRERPSGE